MRFIQICCLMFLLGACETEKQAKPPNVLFILVDDLGYYDLGFAGSQYYETPNIDRLATQSFVFTQGHSASRVCSPSRASILSGQYAATHGITDWIGAKTGEEWNENHPDSRVVPTSHKMQLDSSILTMPEIFRANGYKTFFAGKWHLGGEGSLPQDHGFDINIGGYHAGSPKGGYFAPFDNPAISDSVPHKTNLSNYLADCTNGFIKAHDQEPFFAMLSFYAVHGPIETTRAKWSKFRKKAEYQGIHESGFEEEEILPIRQYQDNPVYAGLVEQMDQAVGRVLSMLDSLGISENTIIVFTSDNGGVTSGDAYSTSNAPFRGGKGYQWEGGVAVPLLIKSAGHHSLKNIDDPVTSVDLYPTLCEMAGIDFSNIGQLEGQSLLAVMNGEKMPERPLFWHYPHYGNQGGEPSSMIRLGKWKLIHYWEDDRLELYDLENDGSELNDLSQTYPDQVAQLDSKLLRWLNERNAQLPKPWDQYDEEKARAFRVETRERKLKYQEQKRREMLSLDYQPNPDWWGSE